jgi:hypothetical protein
MSGRLRYCHCRFDLFTFSMIPEHVRWFISTSTIFVTVWLTILTAAFTGSVMALHEAGAISDFWYGTSALWVFVTVLCVPPPWIYLLVKHVLNDGE